VPQRVATLTLPVPEYDEGIAFYRDVLGFDFLFLEMMDFAADHARYEAAGVRFLERPREEPYGTVAVFEDPFGNRWDLIQPRR
jgi:catechol 2,3-dioxygenase-like lactoylglutathione lyase family enzyme